MIPFAGNKMQKLFLVSFRYRHCCASVVMRPSRYFVNHVAFGTIWVWDHCSKICATELTVPSCFCRCVNQTRVASTHRFFNEISVCKGITCRTENSWKAIVYWSVQCIFWSTTQTSPCNAKALLCKNNYRVLVWFRSPVSGNKECPNLVKLY